MARSYTKTWFDRQGLNEWAERLSHLAETETHALEIGVYEGRSAVWLLEHVLTHPASRFTGIDPWAFRGDTEEVYNRAKLNLAEYIETGKATIIRGCSYKVLAGKDWDTARFDFIYVDGSHRTADVACDSVFCWPLLKSGGIMIWDDYHVKRSRINVRASIRRFLGCIDGQWQLLWSGKQMAIQKVMK